MLLMNDFSDGELRQLKSIFYDDRANTILVNVMDDILKLRALSKDKDFNQDRPEVKPKNGIASQSKPMDNETSRSNEKNYREFQQLMSIFNDKRLFPNTIDVVNAINSHFGFGITYSDYSKRGRRDLVAKFLKLVSKLPPEKRAEKARLFLQSVNKDYDNNDSYKQLFKILIRDE